MAIEELFPVFNIAGSGFFIRCCSEASESFMKYVDSEWIAGGHQDVHA